MEEIIIDGVNVTGCGAYKNKHCLDKTSIMFCDANLCSNYPNCYYKQLKRLEQENAELKSKYKDVANENLKEIYELIKKNDVCRGVVACDHYTYPPIIDKILLELICILSKTGSLEFNGVCSVEEIKEELLKTLIECEKDTGKIKHKVQQLFKELE